MASSYMSMISGLLRNFICSTCVSLFCLSKIVMMGKLSAKSFDYKLTHFKFLLKFTDISVIELSARVT